jgi:hypothetical protein
MEQIDLIQKNLKLHLKSFSWKKHVQLVSTQLYFVNSGFKNGFLVDVGPKLEAQFWQVILHSLCEQNLIGAELIVVEFNENCCILNRPVLLQNVRTPRCFIDITKGSGQPKVMHEHDKRIEKLISVVVEQITQFTDDKTLKIDFNPLVTHLCMPSIFGLLIGYPVIYFYEPNENQSDTYNLEHLDLRVISANFNKQTVPVISFSFPFHLHENLRLSNIICEWKMTAHSFSLSVDELIKNLDVVVL